MSGSTHHTIVPQQHDVLSGRGGTCNTHPGNIEFRRMVALNKGIYISSTQSNKDAVARVVVEAVKGQVPPGRFLSRNKSDGNWYEISNKKALQKTRQAFRDLICKENQRENKMSHRNDEQQTQTANRSVKRSKIQYNETNLTCSATKVPSPAQSGCGRHTPSNKAPGTSVPYWEPKQCQTNQQGVGEKVREAAATMQEASHGCSPAPAMNAKPVVLASPGRQPSAHHSTWGERLMKDKLIDDSYFQEELEPPGVDTDQSASRSLLPFDGSTPTEESGQKRSHPYEECFVQSLDDYSQECSADLSPGSFASPVLESSSPPLKAPMNAQPVSPDDRKMGKFKIGTDGGTLATVRTGTFIEARVGEGTSAAFMHVANGSTNDFAFQAEDTDECDAC